jgi:hypothetical protein
MTPFWLPPVVAIACAILYVSLGDAGRGAKLTVAGLVVVSLILLRMGGIPWAIGLLIQVAVCGYVIYGLRLRG